MYGQMRYPFLANDMATIDLRGLSPQRVGELIAAMNTDGVLHAISGETVTVSEDDEYAVSTVVALMRQAGNNPESSIQPGQSTDVRYDISELHALEVQFLTSGLETAGVPFTYDDHTLTSSRMFESVIDDLLNQAAEYLNDLETTQEKARRVSVGLDSPECENCGASPAAPIDLRRQVGMVVLMKTYSAELILCSNCADQAYRQYQKSTVLKGWTGVRSALMNPIIIGTNAVNRSKHRKHLRGKE